MPSKSAKQARLMAAAAHNPAFAKKVGIPTKVAKEFNAADKGKKFSMGGKLQSRGNAPGLTRSKSGTKSGITQVQGGQDQINKQETRWGSVFGQPKGLPNTTLNKYVGKREGGMAKENMKSDLAQDKKMVKKAVGMHDKQLHGGKKTNLSALKKGGRVAAKGEHPVQKQSKRGAEMVKMCGGGMKKSGRGR